jgi:hypothetical protein
MTRAPRVYAGELPDEFEAITAALGAPRRRPTAVLQRIVLIGVALLQGLLGAASGATLRRFEETVSDHRCFRAEFAVANNVLLNLLLYPVACGAFAVAFGRAGLFTVDMRWWVVLGVLLASGEAAWRMHESFFRGVPLAEARLRGACYGPLVLPLVAVATAVLGRRGAVSAIGFDGFSAGEERYDEKMERARRYGDVYKLEERDDAYVLRVEFPRRLPPTSLGVQLGLPDEMPDYDFELSLQDGVFVVQARVTDPDVRKVTGVAPAFPGEFTTRVALRDHVTGFRHRYHDKTLEVILPKAGS